MFYCCLKRSSVHHGSGNDSFQATQTVGSRTSIESDSGTYVHVHRSPEPVGSSPFRTLRMGVCHGYAPDIEGPKGGAGFVALGLSHLLA
jgi:hypothetical protein